MHNAGCLMQIFNRFGNLKNDMPTEIFAKVGQSHDLVEELAAGAELEDDVVILPGFGKVDQFGDIGVVEVAHDLHFLEDIRSLWMRHVSQSLCQVLLCMSQRTERRTQADAGRAAQVTTAMGMERG